MKLFLTLPLLLAYTFSTAQQIDSAWVAKNYQKKETQIPMRDGVKLFTTIYAPRDQATKHPMLFMRTPYSVAPYGAAFSPRLYTTHWRNYLREGYIIVMQDVRGTYMSEGTFVDVRPFVPEKKSKKDIDESTDAYDAIDWLVKNVPGSNGNVGVFGISYPGFYSTMAALSNHPALKAVSPQAPVTDWFMGDDFHHNGAFALLDAFSFYSGFGKPRPVPTQKPSRGFQFTVKDNYEFFLRTGAIRNFSALLKDSIKFWNELMTHPNYDDWWKSRDARRACYSIKPAMLVVGGTFDAEDCYGAWNLYKAIEAQNPASYNKLVMGPWFHGGWHRSDGSSLGSVRFGSKTAEYFQQLELKFFNHFVKLSDDASKLPEASIFFTGENSWRTFDHWPPTEMNLREVFLQADQKLSFEKPTGIQSFSRYISDPQKPVPYDEGILSHRSREYMIQDQRFASRRTDVLVFETPVLEEDLCLAGPVIADLLVKVTSGDADFVVKLIDVFPDDFSYSDSVCCSGQTNQAQMGGYQMLVRGEIFRGRYRKGFENPQPFDANATENIKFALPDVAHTFQKGHRLMVQIQSSWFPLFDRNPQQFTDIYHCRDKDFQSTDIFVFHQQNAASNIKLPVLMKK